MAYILARWPLRVLLVLIWILPIGSSWATAWASVVSQACFLCSYKMSLVKVCLDNYLDSDPQCIAYTLDRCPLRVRLVLICILPMGSMYPAAWAKEVSQAAFLPSWKLWFETLLCWTCFWNPASWCEPHHYPQVNSFLSIPLGVKHWEPV